jgi:hypothetical protein
MKQINTVALDDQSVGNHSVQSRISEELWPDYCNPSYRYFNIFIYMYIYLYIYIYIDIYIEIYISISEELWPDYCNPSYRYF